MLEEELERIQIEETLRIEDLQKGFTNEQKRIYDDAFTDSLRYFSRINKLMNKRINLYIP